MYGYFVTDIQNNLCGNKALIPAKINRGYNSGTVKDPIGKLEPDLCIVTTITE